MLLLSQAISSVASFETDAIFSILYWLYKYCLRLDAILNHAGLTQGKHSLGGLKKYSQEDANTDTNLKED